MTPFFHTPERIEALRVAAQSWVDTPFFPNGRAKGMGVSCQTLVWMILQECGHLPSDSTAPSGPMDWHCGPSRIEAAMDGEFSAFFESISGPSGSGSPVGELDLGCPGGPVNLLKAGDVVGIEIGNVVHHLLLMLSPSEFIHVMRQGKTIILEIKDATYLSRIRRVWRPIEP